MRRQFFEWAHRGQTLVNLRFWRLHLFLRIIRFPWRTGKRGIRTDGPLNEFGWYYADLTTRHWRLFGHLEITPSWRV